MFLFNNGSFSGLMGCVYHHPPNCATGSSVKEFVEACKAATGVNINVRYLDRRPGDYAQVYSDPSKIQRELKWDAKYTNLRESLEIAWKWHTLHRNGYNSTASA
jgi:UDP-arabinose 4-epimerase